MYDTEENLAQCGEYCDYFEQCQCYLCVCCSHCTSECRCAWVATTPDDVLARLLLPCKSTDYK
jgi:hypothetical protein